MATGTGKLDLVDDPPFHRAEWRIQRVGWVIWSLIVLAGLLGLMGPGPLSNVESSSPDGSVLMACGAKP